MDAARPVERLVAGVGERVGAVVDVEQDGIVAVDGGVDRLAHVASDERHARIGERIARQRGELTAIPLDYRWHQLSDLDLRARADGVEHGA